MVKPCTADIPAGVCSLTSTGVYLLILEGVVIHKHELCMTSMLPQNLVSGSMGAEKLKLFWHSGAAAKSISTSFLCITVPVLGLAGIRQSAL